MNAYTFPIEAGHIMMFARAVGDSNRIYYDADYAKETEPGNIIAPPTFTQSCAHYEPGYPLRPVIGQPWYGSGKYPSGIQKKNDKKPVGSGDEKNKASEKPKNSGVLHAEQHFEYHRHVKPGDVLTVTTKMGKTWQKEGKRSGKLVFFEVITEFHDQHGELVITKTMVGVNRQ